MRINHVALYVKDLERMKDFYVTYFKGTANELYHNPKTGLMTYFIQFDNDVRLELMVRPDVHESSNRLFQEGWTHMAISVGSKVEVDQLTQTLIEAGCQHISGPRTTGDGYYESLVLDLEGNPLEITL